MLPHYTTWRENVKRTFMLTSKAGSAIVQGMKRTFVDFLNHTGDQILSTFLLAATIAILVKGTLALAHDPPPRWMFFLVFGIGFFLGVVKFANYKPVTKGNADDKRRDN